MWSARPARTSSFLLVRGGGSVPYADRHRSFGSLTLRSVRAAIWPEVFVLSGPESRCFILCPPPQRTETHIARFPARSQSFAAGRFSTARVLLCRDSAGSIRLPIAPIAQAVDPRR